MTVASVSQAVAGRFRDKFFGIGFIPEQVTERKRLRWLFLLQMSRNKGALLVERRPDPALFLAVPIRREIAFNTPARNQKDRKRHNRCGPLVQFSEHMTHQIAGSAREADPYSTISRHGYIGTATT